MKYILEDLSAILINTFLLLTLLILFVPCVLLIFITMPIFFFIEIIRQLKGASL